ncbi:MAG: hypothetical protein ACPHID_00900 [Thermoplasmatota archaeon]
MAFTAQDAAQALHDVPNVEERLTTNVNGITLMIWALATSGIFLTYGVLDLMNLQDAENWAYAGAWLPFVAAAMLASSHLWRAHHQALNIGGNDHRWWPSFAVLIGAAGAMLLVTEILLDLNWGVALAMLFANGVLLAGFGVFCSGHVRSIHFAFGAFMGIEAIAIGLLDLGVGGHTLATAAAALIGWGVPGLLLARKG